MKKINKLLTIIIILITTDLMREEEQLLLLTQLKILKITLIIILIKIKYPLSYPPNHKSMGAIITFPLTYPLIIIFHLKIINKPSYHLLIIIKIILITIIFMPNHLYPTIIIHPIILITQILIYRPIIIILIPILINLILISNREVEEEDRAINSAIPLLINPLEKIICSTVPEII